MKVFLCYQSLNLNKSSKFKNKCHPSLFVQVIFLGNNKYFLLNKYRLDKKKSVLFLKRENKKKSKDKDKLN